MGYWQCILPLWHGPRTGLQANLNNHMQCPSPQFLLINRSVAKKLQDVHLEVPQFPKITTGQSQFSGLGATTGTPPHFAKTALSTEQKGKDPVSGYQQFQGKFASLSYSLPQHIQIRDYKKIRSLPVGSTSRLLGNATPYSSQVNFHHAKQLTESSKRSEPLSSHPATNILYC